MDKSADARYGLGTLAEALIRAKNLVPSPV